MILLLLLQLDQEKKHKYDNDVVLFGKRVSGFTPHSSKLDWKISLLNIHEAI